MRVVMFLTCGSFFLKMPHTGDCISSDKSVQSEQAHSRGLFLGIKKMRVIDLCKILFVWRQA
jgi:hypothetical protein